MIRLDRPTAADLPTYDAALKSALSIVEPLLSDELVSLVDACGRVLVEPVRADRDLPPFDRSALDGYAVRAADIVPGAALPVSFTVPAGSSSTVPLPPGACAKIATGAPVPPGADTVIPHERTDRQDPVRFDVDTAAPGDGVHQRGRDARAENAVILPGTLLQAHHLGIAASVGAMSLTCRARPRVTLLSSGDEIRPADSAVEPHQVRNANAPMLRELIKAIGGQVVQCSHLSDDRDQTIHAVREAIIGSDLLLTVGGVSAGERDYFPAAFQDIQLEALVQGAAIQPGKPVRIGRAPMPQHDCIVIALPGNPVSALACACLFVWPVARRRLGLDPHLPWRTVTLAEPVRPNSRRQAFRPAELLRDQPDHARIPPWAGSGDLVHTSTTHGLVRLPVQEHDVEIGTALPFLPYPSTPGGFA